MSSALTRLKNVGYLPPQTVLFNCRNCDYYQRHDPSRGKCYHPEIRTTVEALGCCNYWTHEGVTSGGK